MVTRPAHQAGRLEALVRGAGGNPILFPVIEIVATGNLPSLIALIDRLDEFDFAIFVSPNAVSMAMNLIKARGPLPPHLRFAVTGASSVRELGRYGIASVIAPATRFDSEALLELPALQDVGGKRVVIFRGDGGRELLGDTLIARGAAIEYAECYRRVKPQLDAAPLLNAWASNAVHAIIVTSSEGLHNLFDLVGEPGQAWLKKTPLFVPHTRIAKTARALGLAAVVETAQGDEGLVQGLTLWFAGR